MQHLQRGEKRSLSDLGVTLPAQVRVTLDLPGADLSVFGLDGARQLADDRYFVFYNQPHSPAGEVRLQPDAQGATFTLDLARLPEGVQRLVFVATHDTRPFSQLGRLHWVIAEQADVTLTGADFAQERAVMIAELYRHAGGWRLGAVGQGFAGGLQALLESFGGEVTDAPPPPPPPSVNLRKEARVRLDKDIAQHAPQLVNLIKTAEVSLQKRGLQDHTARVALVLDISGSMGFMYRSGLVQRLTEKALALASRFDDNGVIDVFLFGQRAHDVGELGVRDITGAVDRLMQQHGLEGGTQYGAAIRAVRTHYFGAADARAAPLAQAAPVFVLFVTDGETQGRELAEAQLAQASREPVFWKFMGLGLDRFEFLKALGDLPGRTVNNTDFFIANDLEALPDAEFYDHLTSAYPAFLEAARASAMLPGLLPGTR